MKLMFYVYVLRSQKNGSIYVGSTKNLEKRIDQHNAGLTISTMRNIPWELIYYEAYTDEILARKREKRLKYHGNAMKELKSRALISSDVKSPTLSTLDKS